MQTINRQTIEALKAAGHMFAAGALAYELREPINSYGCHYGMRSSLVGDREEFERGWKAAKAD